MASSSESHHRAASPAVRAARRSFAGRRGRRVHPARDHAIGSRLMRHFLSGPKPRHVPSLAQRVPPPAAPAALVARPALELPRPTGGLPALPPAVARLLEVAQLAEEHRSPAGGGSADDDMQRDHGPPPGTEGLDFHEDLCDQERVEPRTSRSRGTTEGSEVMAPGPRYFGVRDPSCTAPRRSARLPGDPAPRSARRPAAGALRRGRAAPRAEWRNRAAHRRRAARGLAAARNRVVAVMLYAAIARGAVAAAGALRRDRS